VWRRPLHGKRAGSSTPVRGRGDSIPGFCGRHTQFGSGTRALAVPEWAFGKNRQELYDHDNDPQELHNLAADAKYADVVAQMKALLKQVHPAPVPGGQAAPGTKEKFCN
jgi:hypothetical protein